MSPTPRTAPRATDRYATTMMVAVPALVLALGLFEGLTHPTYWVKAAVKLVLFGAIPVALALAAGVRPAQVVGTVSWRRLRWPALAAVIVIPLAVLALWFASAYVDLGRVTANLGTTVGTKAQFIPVALYIVTVNSMLEEFLFRGVALDAYGRRLPRPWAALVSSVLFGVYHVAIVGTWFSPGLVIGTVALLTLAGLILTWVRTKTETIVGSWIVHASVNAVLNLFTLLALLP